jgi:hypothetical protein
MRRDQNWKQEIILRLTLEKPTVGVDFALQKGRGSAFTIEQCQRSIGRNLKFEFPVMVKAGKTGAPDFAGPHVQGSAGDRFFYINIGTYAGQINTPWGRRLKVPLYVIDWSAIEAGRPLTARIPGTGKGGGPSCAYEWRKRVDSNWGWEPEKR